MRVLAWPYANQRGNPYTRLLYRAMEARGATVDEFAPWRVLIGRYDVWHMHWPDGAFNRDGWFSAWRGAIGLRTLLRIARLRGIRLVWTAHNIGGHEVRHSRLEERTWQDLTRQLDAYISLSHDVQDKLQDQYTALRHCSTFVIPHGHYRGEYPDYVTKEEARNTLSIPQSVPVLLYFGYIRPYKNVPFLIRTVRALEDDLRLLVAGNPQTDELATAVRRKAGESTRIHLCLDFIPSEDVQLYFRAADLVVLPYAEILNSGTALLGLSFDRPVLVPDKGAMGELRERVGANWVRTYASPLTPKAIREGLGWVKEPNRSDRPPLDAFDWGRIAHQTLQAFETL